MNTYVISIALPAVVLAHFLPYLHRAFGGEWGASVAILPLVPWVTLGLAISFERFTERGDLAATAPMITGTLLAIEAGLAPNLRTLMLGVGTPLSLTTVPLIHRFFFLAGG